MKILFVCTKFPPSIGGMQKSNHEIVKAINDLGHDVEVFTIGMRNHDNDFDNSEVYNIERVSNTQKGSYYNLIKRTKFFFQFYISLRKKMKKFNPDKLIFADDFSRKILGIFYFPSDIEIITFVSVPEVNDVRGNRSLTLIKNSIVKKAYLKSNHIVYVSESTKKALINYFGENIVSDAENHIIYRTLDNKFFDQNINENEIERLKNKYNLTIDGDIIISVSRIEKSKGIDFVLKALSNLKDDYNFKYVIVGDGDYLNELKKITRDLKLDDKVIFTGEISFDDVINYYDLADLFVLPSRRGTSESFGRVFAEASARNTAVIGNNTGGVKEVIIDGETGLLVNPNKIDDIKNAIRKLLEDQSLLDKYAKKGSFEAQNRFSKDELKTKLLKVLN